MSARPGDANVEEPSRPTTPPAVSDAAAPSPQNEATDDADRDNADHDGAADPASGTEPDGEGAPSLQDAMSAAAHRSGVGRVLAGSEAGNANLLAAVGGVRGIVEAILPGLAFLVTFAITRELVPSVVAPAIVALGFIVVRLVTRSPVMSAVAGAVGVAVSAAIALWTGDVNDSFVPGLITNLVYLCVFALSVVVRWPLIGMVVGLLTGDVTGWRADPAKRRSAFVATLVWVGLFLVRLLVEVPLYFAGATAALAGAKLVLGVPFYAAVLWITWLLMRSAYRRPAAR